MAEDDSQQDAPPSLAPPSLGLPKLRRRKRTAAPAPTDEQPPSAPVPPTPDAPAPELPAPVAAVDEPVAAEPADEPVAIDDVVEPVDAPVDAPVDTATAETVHDDPAPADPAPADPAPDDVPPVDFAPAPAADGYAVEQLDESLVQERSGPVIPGRVAAVLTGLLVGLLMVVATGGAGKGCSSLSDTGSCGGIGLVALVVILVVGVVFGSLLLRLFQVPDPGSTSFLAVGLTTVVALLFFAKELTAWWMIIAIPVVAMAMYAASHWVTETYSDVSFD